MDIYEELGVKKVINAAGTYTAVGASRMHPKTLEAMAQAADSYIQLNELLKMVNKKIATMTHNEAAFVCNSCSTAIYLSVAAFIARKYDRPFKYLEREQIQRCEVIGFWNQHIPYDYAVEQTGAKLKFIGDSTVMGGLNKETLRMAIGDNTVGIYFASRTPKGYYAPNRLNLEDVIEVAREYKLPVLVDAAAQLPPKSNLWEFTAMGADIVTFSGGKDLAGPQASGLIVGKKDIMSRIEETGFPNYSVGRLMKIGREEIVALYTAIKLYLEQDEDKRLEWCEEQIRILQKELEDSKLYQVSRCWPNQAGQPLPRAFVAIREGYEINGEQLAERLMAYDPGIYCITEGRSGVYINPMCLKDDDIGYVIEKLLKIERDLT